MPPSSIKLSSCFDFDKFAQQFATCPNNANFVVAYSGGLDSTVLLHLMTELLERQPARSELRALHIHHGQSDNADQWAEHCRQTCKKLQVPLEIIKVNVQDSGASLENKLRDARYKIFQNSLHENDVLLMAHHADDQAETMLYRLARGAGLAGMSGIPKSRTLGKSWVFRPLLEYDRDTLLRAAKGAQLSWVEDESNRSLAFDRNYLRHQVLPRLNSRWPGINQVLSRQAAINQQTLEALDYCLLPILETLTEGGAGLDLDGLQRFPESIQVNLLRVWLAEQGFQSIPYDHYRRLLSEVASAAQDANPELKIGELVFRRHQGSLLVNVELEPHDPQQTWQWRIHDPLVMPGAGALFANAPSADENTNTLLRKPHSETGFRVEFRKGGERCRPIGRGGSRPIKKLLQEYAVPPWLRDRVPLIYEGDDLVAIADLCVCEAGAIKPGEEGLQITWQRPS